VDVSIDATNSSGAAIPVTCSVANGETVTETVPAGQTRTIVMLTGTTVTTPAEIDYQCLASAALSAGPSPWSSKQFVATAVGALH
jgi:hypothetical protein